MNKEGRAESVKFERQNLVSILRLLLLKEDDLCPVWNANTRMPRLPSFVQSVEDRETADWQDANGLITKASADPGVSESQRI